MDDNTQSGPVAAPAPTPTPTEATPAKKAFLAALAKAQGQFGEIEKNSHVVIKPRDGAAYEFDYADLAEILNKTRAALSDNGLSTRMLLTGADGDTVWLNSIVGHADGYEDVSSLPINVGGDIKQFGGRITYIRRYLLGPQLGVAGEGDADEDGAPAGSGVGDAMRGAAVTTTEKSKTPARRSANAQKAPAARGLPAEPDGDEPPPPEGFESPAAAPAKAPPPPPAPAPTPAAPPPPAAAPTPAPAAPAQAPAAAPAAAPATNGAVIGPDSGELASQGEVAYLCRRAKQRNVNLDKVFESLGLNHPIHPDELAKRLTKAQWTAAMKQV